MTMQVKNFLFFFPLLLAISWTNGEIPAVLYVKYVDNNISITNCNAFPLSLSLTCRICSSAFFEAVCLRSSGGCFRFGVELSVPDKALGLHTHKIKPVPPPAGILTNYQLPSHGISCRNQRPNQGWSQPSCFPCPSHVQSPVTWR